jgi:hypothetical protein
MLSHGFVLLKLQHCALCCQHYLVAKFIKPSYKLTIKRPHLSHLIAQYEWVITWQVGTQVGDTVTLSGLYKI